MPKTGKKICGLCGRKVIFGKSSATKFRITEKLQQLIKQFANKSFDMFDPRFPSSLCGTCRITLCEHEKGNFKRQLPKMLNFHDIRLPKSTRTRNDECNCYICLTGRFIGHEEVEKGRGHTKNIERTIIDESNGLFGSSSQQQLPVLTSIRNQKANEKCSKLCICTFCFHEIGKGKRHSCTLNDARINVMGVIERLPEKQQQQVVTGTLKKFSDNKPGHNYQNVSLKLATGGSTTRVVLNPKASKNVLFSSEHLDNYQVNSGASSHQMKKFTNFLRCQAGKNSVPPHYSQHLSEMSKSLTLFYKTSIKEFDMEGLLAAVLEKREQIGVPTVKVMADGGQGFFKICITILPENYSPDLDRGLENTELIQEDGEGNDQGEIKSQRSLYVNGGSIGKKGKLTSVNRLIMLCIVPQVKETYENVQLMFRLTNLNAISFKFVSDFKLILLINGQQTATATYPCPYCFITLNDLRYDMTVKETYGDLKRSYAKFCFEGKNKKLAKECHSTINLPLFEEADDMYVIEKCIIPELHLLQGFVNHLFWDGLVPLLGRDRALLWPKKLSLIAKNYHGDIFEGNACRKLLKKSDILTDPEIIKNVGVLSVIPFISSFKIMNKIVEKCFMTGKVASGYDYEADINMLAKCFKATGVSETLKIHVIIHHLQDSINFLKNNGLGLWSEQAGESVHRNFLIYWNRYKINRLDDPRYIVNLKKAVVEFSSHHL
ncbi:unnamed protein product [Brassicogethes aeneus]|uniref:Uncharacterized protein n=1 Tax=Brassicogethes aeneus TaxID=1431903 RepID=A0A9P0B8I7_BRAAE|nr:unnamed protein product [Brassicogethes aeneus]